MSGFIAPSYIRNVGECLFDSTRSVEGLEHCVTSLHRLAVDLSNDIAAYASKLCRIVWERG
jgi:hypothetical protein